MAPLWCPSLPLDRPPPWTFGAPSLTGRVASCQSRSLGIQFPRAPASVMAAARSSHRPLLSLRSRCTSGPQVIAQLARKLCFLPMLGWGLAGTPIPKRVRKEGGGEGGGEL